MKVAIISLYSRFGDKTGDIVQADKTADAISALGHNVVRGYFKPETSEIFDSNGKCLGTWFQVLGDQDVIHAIPPIPWKFIRGQPHINAKFACSTVFWRSYTYTRVLHKVGGHITLALLKDYIRTFLAWLGIPTYMSYVGYNLLLPNSEDEIKCVKRYCRRKNGAKIIAVPNAIDPLPAHVDELPRSGLAPQEDYILVPGVFAARKNQLTFIQAMKGCAYPIVFIGDGPMLAKCKSEATPTMRFLGHIAHGSKEFYSIMKYARVVCLPSNCETPGIAALEAAALGARPVVPYEGGTCQYFGWDAEYIDPLSLDSIRTAIDNAWHRGRLTDEEPFRYKNGTWERCAQITLNAYGRICNIAV